MNSLFAIFDPVAVFNINLNWLSRIILTIIVFPSIYWTTKNRTSWILRQVISYLIKEISLLLNILNSPGHSHMLISLFIFIALNNFFGLLPYVFTASRHLSFSLRFALLVWIRVILIAVMKDLGATLAHLVPLGTPVALMPLIVLIELVRNIIRPITLSVRLAANMVAGHLLLTLIGSSASLNRFLVLIIIIISLFLIIILESAVALIQSYVFSTLSSLYLADVNSTNLNYKE